MQPLGVWIFHDENRRVPLNTCKNAETKLPSNGGVPSTRRRHITNCAWSHNAPTVGYKTSWIMNHASFFTRATLIEAVVYHKISFLLTASLTASSPFTDSGFILDLGEWGFAVPFCSLKDCSYGPDSK